jgi:hypothetical protein
MHHSTGRPEVSHYARGLLTATAVFASIAQAVIPTPTVTGPIPSDTPGSPGHNYTYWATDIVLKNFGYTEEEFFFEGTANRYDAAAPSGAVGNANRCSPIANIVTANVPYKSRMRVIRPTDPAKFNGTVVVEWTNVTNGYDTPVWWLKPKAFYLREGYAHVEVSAQNAGLNSSPNGLRNWSPTRYGSLDVIGGGTQTGDVLSYDIFSQAAAAIRNVPVVLGGLRAQVLIGVGESQSAGRLGVYANAIHSRDPVYNGIIMSEGGEVICNNAATTPVMKVLSETEFAGQTNEISALQPDTDKFRMWPVAGMSHSDQYSLLSRAALLQRDIGQLAQDTCATPARSRVETRYLYASSVDAMNKWIRVGTPPPIAGRFVLTNPPAAGVARDAFGNAIGAIRTAEIDVPVAKEAADTCGLGGTHVPFTTPVLTSLYSSHQDYVNKVTQAALDSVAKGFVLPADAQDEIDRAQASIWGMGLECGPLCADVRQFPLNPSSILLRNQTAFLLIRGAESKLLPILDAVTLAIAQGYTLGTGTAASKEKFAQAATLLQRYIANVQLMLLSGNTKPETAALLSGQATTLRSLVLAQTL